MLDLTEKAGCRGTSEAVVPVSSANAPDAQAALEFLRWFAPEGPWILDTCKKPDRAHRCIQPHQPELVERFLRDNAQRDIYVLLGIPHGLPTGQPNKELMAGSQWLWVDLDPPPEVWDKPGGHETAEGVLEDCFHERAGHPDVPGLFEVRRNAGQARADVYGVWLAL